MINNKNPTEVEPRISRRASLASATATTLSSALDSVAVQNGAKKKELARELPPSVQMQFMRPAQLEKVVRSFPVVYVPIVLIEGDRLPLGNDARQLTGLGPVSCPEETTQAVLCKER